MSNDHRSELVLEFEHAVCALLAANVSGINVPNKMQRVATARSRLLAALAASPKAREALTPEQIDRAFANACIFYDDDVEDVFCKGIRIAEELHGIADHYCFLSAAPGAEAAPAAQRSAGMTEEQEWEVATLYVEDNPVNAKTIIEAHDEGDLAPDEAMQWIDKLVRYNVARASLGAPSSEEQRDAARYQWLRAGGERGCCVIGFGGDTLDGDDLDTAIDAAMAASTAEKGETT